MICGRCLYLTRLYLTNALSQLVSDCNTHKHRMIDMRPIDITPAIAEKLLTTVYSKIKIASPVKFKIGDSIRMNKYKIVFEKG